MLLLYLLQVVAARGAVSSLFLRSGVRRGCQLLRLEEWCYPWAFMADGLWVRFCYVRVPDTEIWG